eukprot:NODE_10017_length_454_cov_1.762963_g8915_i0.p2 GENE.NODE_10017_length_454_cov_1.762963_g8915_i0~~NODE_10017_length_454_cov_1.762963_g8915_i0.p2  ORF type:complete len:138 (-),score=10.02 NODE_10017_length_454_cov_1.762963_g8915_i0:41-433(-)
MSTLDPQMPQLSADTISTGLDRMESGVFERLKEQLKDAPGVSTTLDLWTRRAQLEAYAALTAHWVLRWELQRHVLAVEHIPAAHLVEEDGEVRLSTECDECGVLVSSDVGEVLYRAQGDVHCDRLSLCHD